MINVFPQDILLLYLHSVKHIQQQYVHHLFQQWNIEILIIKQYGNLYLLRQDTMCIFVYY